MYTNPAQVAVFEEGWAGDKFYILLHGKLRVFKAEVELALLDTHPADGGAVTQTSYPFFGEMSLMDAAPRMASVHTITPCKILALSRANFGRFLSLVPDFKDRIARTKVSLYVCIYVCVCVCVCACVVCVRVLCVYGVCVPCPAMRFVERVASLIEPPAGDRLPALPWCLVRAMTRFIRIDIRHGHHARMHVFTPGHPDQAERDQCQGVTA